ncbi:hypothetical protein B0T18DRAFT_430304 [Schizothecium vesticola]|uniref:Uncharacterized protein n=1 Tax=Schizothecium vesticola TaxID=314040 RepID=A0AA40EP39_9PEZI|nr:hypothetical protein B0T18DRAFT_430304 [Schizothecium vesticola]
MLASWKAGRTLTPEEALKPAGDQHVAVWTAGLGMPAKKKDAFLAGMGMMNTYGPLWVTTGSDERKSFSPHAKILVQIDGDGSDNGNNTTFIWINPQD